VPMLNRSLDMVQLLLPYLIYHAVRAQVCNDSSLVDDISKYLNQIL